MKKYLTIEGYANKEGITERTVYNRINSGKLKTKKIKSLTLIEIENEL